MEPHKKGREIDVEGEKTVIRCLEKVGVSAEKNKLYNTCTFLVWDGGGVKVLGAQEITCKQACSYVFIDVNTKTHALLYFLCLVPCLYLYTPPPPPPLHHKG